MLLVSCYELGQEPLGLAVPAGVLARSGIPVRLLDLAVSPLDADAVAQADLVAISTPMHTALRLGVRVAAIVREINPDAHICFFGLYAELNEPHLVPSLANSCLGAEFESGLAELARSVIAARACSTRARDAASQRATHEGARSRERAIDLTPSRDGFTNRERYAKLALGDERREVGYVVATRGCKHLCRHCPLPPVYAGAFYALPLERVLADIEGLVARGARHLTFADADFLNGPTHALRIAREIARRFPGVTFDYTAKIEHLRVHERAVAELHDLGALFVVSAVESFNDAVLATLEKGHTREDALAVMRRFARRGQTLRPTFVPFTPWETRESYAELFAIVEGEGLVEHIDTVQYTIRLLIPEGSLLLASEAMQRHLGAFNADSYSHRWTHPDPAMDRLQRDAAAAVSNWNRDGRGAEDAFRRLRAMADPAWRPERLRSRRAGPVPRLTEDWFC